MKKTYLSYEDAKKYVQSLNLKSSSEWRTLCIAKKIPNNMPYNPNKFYENKGWESYIEFFGTKNNYLSYDAAKKYIHSLNFKKQNEFFKFMQSKNKPDNIPLNVKNFYKDKGFTTIYDFIGIKQKEYLSYDEAKKYLATFKLKNSNAFQKLSLQKKFIGIIPTIPAIYYKNKGFVSYNDLLSNNSKSNRYTNNFMSYEDAKKYVNNLNLKSCTEWFTYAKNRTNKKEVKIPYDAHIYYSGKGWESWQDFLNINEKVKINKKYLSYDNAKKVLHSLNIKNIHEFNLKRKSCKNVLNIPSNPSGYYKDKGWVSYNEFLNINNRRGVSYNFVPYGEAKKMINSLNIKTFTEYKSFCKTKDFPLNIPTNPNIAYKNKGWVSYNEFLKL